MAYVVPIHRPSSIRHALKLNFLDAEEECLAVAKANRLDFYALTPEGLSLQHSKAIYGKVVALQRIRPEGALTDHLFVATDRYMYFTLSWDPSSKQLKTEKSYVDVADRSAREAQTGERCLADPTSRVLTLELFEGIMTVLPIVNNSNVKKRKQLQGDLGSLSDPIHYRISEMFVRSSAFLYPREPSDLPTVALLYEDPMQKIRLQLRQINYPPSPPEGDTGTGELKTLEGLTGELELGASHLIPVPGPAFGILILGETSITYYNEVTKDASAQPLDEATIFVTWERIDDQRWVVADDYGKLYMLMIVLDSSSDVIDWKFDELGETSRASALIHLGGGQVFVGSHQGDSQVVQIREQGIEVLQSFANIAPILDFTIMDMGNRSGEGQTNEYSSGQARIVTGSGAYKDGSLRSVRSGVGLEEVGIVGDLDFITNISSLRTDLASDSVDTLVLSFVDQTRVFQFDAEGAVEEREDFLGLKLSETTLLTRNLDNGRLLQVTESTVQISDLESSMVTSSWAAPSNITAASADGDSVLLALGGLRLFSLRLGNDIQELASKDFAVDSQVSCIHCSENVAFVGFSQKPEVSILDISSFNSISSTQVAEDSFPRSLLLTQTFLDREKTLYIAMADGTVVTYSVSATSHQLTGQNSIILGTQQANFSALPRGDGSFNVFASCDHPSLIYASEGRLVYSAVTAEKATSVCSFDSPAYPGCVVIATPDGLRIAQIDSERTTHVQTLQINETVRRIAYSPALKAFGLGTIKRTLLDGAEVVQSHFKLADEILFKSLDTYALEEDELVESVMRCELDDGTGELVERFVVGTAFLDEGREESTQGRLLILEVTEDRKLKLVLEHALKGGCRCLAMMDGKIIAALIKTVVLFSFAYSTPGSPALTKAASFRCSTAPIDIHVSGDTFAVADLMKSTSIVQYIPGQYGAPDKLSEIARHYATSWSTAVSSIDENVYLESDAEGNLLVLQRDLEGATEEDKRRLRKTSEMRLGEMVNRIRRVDVATSPDAAVVPKAFLATVEGSIYLLATIDNPEAQNLLMTLQTNLAECVQSPGHVDFNRYRAYKSQVRAEEEPYRFVDGDLIERFLDAPQEVQERACRGLTKGVEEVKDLVEGLRRLH